jgi:hypothetical protein
MEDGRSHSRSFEQRQNKLDSFSHTNFQTPSNFLEWLKSNIGIGENQYKNYKYYKINNA